MTTQDSRSRGGWRKSPYSTNGGNCVEVSVLDRDEVTAGHKAAADKLFVMRDSKDPAVVDMRAGIREFRDQNTRVLNAMREDLTDMRSRVDDGFTEIRGKLDAAAAGQQQIVGLLNTLISQGEDR